MTTAARRPLSPPPRIRYAHGAQPQPVQPAAPDAGSAPSLDRSRPVNRANNELVRELLCIDPDTLDDARWDAAVTVLCEMGLDGETIRFRAGAMLLPVGEPLNDEQVYVAGLDHDTTVRRNEWLARINKADPALARRDEELARQRCGRSLGSITETLPTDALVPASLPSRATLAAPTPAKPVQPQIRPVQEAPAPAPVMAPADDDARQDHDGNALEPDLSETDQRCLVALVMLREGKPRKDIAAHFGKDASTIWRWLRRAETIQRDKLNAVRPADLLADFEATFQAKRADLEAEYVKARDAGSVRKMVELSREVRRWHMSRFDVHQRSGTFRNYTHPAVLASFQDAERQNLGTLGTL